MNRMIYRATSYFCCSMALFGSSLIANEEEIPSELVRVEPGNRPMAHTEWLKIQAEREATEEEFAKNPDAIPTEEQQAEPSSETDSSLKVSANFKTPQASVHYTTHQGAFHSPVAISALGDVIELEDGSCWVVAPGDNYRTLNWLTSDLLVITPNHSWFSSHLFCITNQNTGDSVRVNLSLGPIYNGLFTHWIVAINYYTQELCLEDGSIWKLSGFDSSIYNNWLLNDTVIIGVNDGFLSASKPNILINVNTLTYSKAKCIF